MDFIIFGLQCDYMNFPPTIRFVLPVPFPLCLCIGALSTAAPTSLPPRPPGRGGVRTPSPPLSRQTLPPSKG